MKLDINLPDIIKVCLNLIWIKYNNIEIKINKLKYKFTNTESPINKLFYDFDKID